MSVSVDRTWQLADLRSFQVFEDQQILIGCSVFMFKCNKKGVDLFGQHDRYCSDYNLTVDHDERGTSFKNTYFKFVFNKVKKVSLLILVGYNNNNRIQSNLPYATTQYVMHWWSLTGGGKQLKHGDQRISSDYIVRQMIYLHYYCLYLFSNYLLLAVISETWLYKKLKTNNNFIKMGFSWHP